LDGGAVQALHQFLGQGQWQDEAWLRQHWSLVDETRGEADGVCIGEGADVPKPGEHAVGVAHPWCGRVGQVEKWQAGGFAADASRTGSTRRDRRL
jgi:SRSO17 transposase